MFKVSFFIKEKEQELFPLLQPLRFSINRDHKVVWRYKGSEFVIQPFSVVGRESQGYRAYFKGSPEAFQYLFDFALGCFSPKINGIEYVYSSDQKQTELVKIAENNSLRRESIYGLYRQGRIGIVILPNGRMTFQIRNCKIRQSELASVFNEIESVVQLFKPQDFNLFSFTTNNEEGEFLLS